MSEEEEKYIFTQIWDGIGVSRVLLDVNIVGNWKDSILDKRGFERATSDSFFNSNFMTASDVLPEHLSDILTVSVTPRPDWQVGPHFDVVSSREADSIWSALDRLYDLIVEVHRLREEVDSLKFIHGYAVKV
jgi:hypothetical protein